LKRKGATSKRPELTVLKLIELLFLPNEIKGFETNVNISN